LPDESILRLRLKALQLHQPRPVASTGVPICRVAQVLLDGASNRLVSRESHQRPKGLPAALHVQCSSCGVRPYAEPSAELGISSLGTVALHVKPDKMPEQKRETFTA
jgi:hypothetical protein